VTLSASHVAQPGHTELDAERTSERRKSDAERNQEVHHSQHSVSKCLQKQATSMDITFLLSAPRHSKSHGSFQVFQASPACPSDKISVKLKTKVELWWNFTERGKREYWGQNSVPVSFCTPHTPTWTGLELNPGLCGKRPATHSLKHSRVVYYLLFNPLNAKLNSIYHLLALLGTHYILHISRIRVNIHESVHRSINQ
jgi:hypothetical protein